MDKTVKQLRAMLRKYQKKQPRIRLWVKKAALVKQVNRYLAAPRRSGRLGKKARVNYKV